MSEFKKYPSIKRLGHDDNKEILEYPEDTLVIEEKVDGGNGSFWLDEDGAICHGSRNRDLTSAEDEKTFSKQRGTLMRLLEGKTINPDYIYYCEWMAKHTINYTDAPDVIGLDIRVKHSMGEEGPGLFLGRDSREQEFERLGIENTPIVWRGKVVELKKINVNELISKSKYYDGKMEGVVLKNYCRKATYDNHQLYAKIVADEFKENNKAVFGNVRQKNSDTSKIVEQYVTDARIRKTIEKEINENGKTLELKLMSVVPTNVIKDILKEEYGDIFKNYNFIDFKEMKQKTAKNCLRMINEMMTTKAMER